jgi:hypothetical protein
LGSPHGEVGLAIWQNSKLSNSNVESVTWNVDLDFTIWQTVAATWKNIQIAKSNFAIWQT